MTRYTYATTLSWGGDEPTAEVEVEVSFSIAWGRPAQISGPPEQCYPGEADEIDDIKLLTVDGKSRPWNMGFGYVSDDEFVTMVLDELEACFDAMICEAAAEDEARRDDEADYRREAKWERF